MKTEKSIILVFAQILKERRGRRAIKPNSKFLNSKSTLLILCNFTIALIHKHKNTYIEFLRRNLPDGL